MSVQPHDQAPGRYIRWQSSYLLESHAGWDHVQVLKGKHYSPQVHFMVNNLTASDVADRAAQIQKAIWPEFKDWFANYLVVKRAAQVRCLSEMQEHITCRRRPVLTSPSGCDC